ncbi:MAG TPA: 6-pyruvoyl-tetrahydropterin synthase-related protein, partial [Dissulfurispiraceae bacterium]
MARKIDKALLADVAVLAAIAGFLLTYFSPEYLLSANMTTGGDTASHYYTALYMKAYLLPRGRLSGWMPGNFAGYPILQFYFPLPFLVMSALSCFIPMQIAFKIVTVLGIFLLPLCTYGALRLLRYAFPVPVLGALFTLPFLFNEANSMWGGNIMSTLAGEFAYSIGFALSILFIGSVYRGITTGRHAVKNAVLIALIGLAHGYALLYSGVISLCFLFANDFPGKLKYLLRVHLLGFMLMGIWIFPLLWYMPETTHLSAIWEINSLSEVFPPVLVPFVVLALAGRTAGFAVFVRDAAVGTSLQALFSKMDKRMLYLWSCVMIGGFLFLASYALHITDIRFLPYLQALLPVIAGIEAGLLCRRIKLYWLTPIILFLAVVLWLDGKEQNLHSWIQWNYTGFENKRDWPVLSDISAYLKGAVSDPRVAYEHSPLNKTFGSERAFESLPLFSGRSTLEGLYMESTASSPFVYYLQSE